MSAESTGSSPRGRSSPTGATRLVAVIGSPVRHSLSPTIHNAAFEAVGLDWVCVALDVSPGHAAGAVEGARALGLDGLSVTMPHKSAVIGSLDELTDVARRLEAVNCVYRVGDRLVGDNTDGAGFLSGLRREWDLGVSDLRVMVLGSGGAAAAVIDAVAGAGAREIGVIGRNRPAVAAVVARSGGRASEAAPSDIASADLVVNATPVGMEAHPGEPTDAEIGSGQFVVDLVYHPAPTAWMARCEASGARVMGGLPMLVGQAELAFRLWTGHDAPHEAMVGALGSS